MKPHSTRPAAASPEQLNSPRSVRDVSNWPYRRVVWDSISLGFASAAVLAIAGRLDHELTWKLLTRENGLLEHAQVVFLLLASVVGGVAYAFERESVWRSILLTGSTMALMVALRELQSSPDASPAMIFGLDDATFRSLKHAGIAVGAVVIAARALHAWIRHPKDRQVWFRLRFIWPIVPFTALIALSQLSEEMKLVLVEEMSELVAYAMILCTLVWRLSFRVRCYWRAESRNPVSAHPHG